MAAHFLPSFLPDFLLLMLSAYAAAEGILTLDWLLGLLLCDPLRAMGAPLPSTARP